jgi:prophage regulatory protein
MKGRSDRTREPRALGVGKQSRFTRTDVRPVGAKPEHDRELAQVALKFLRFTAVRERTGLSRSTIWRLQRVGAFPKHHRISSNAVAWVEQDVIDWLDADQDGRAIMTVVRRPPE